MTPARFLQPAEVEMVEAAIYYEEQAEGLGTLFLSTLEGAIRNILENPNAWPITSNDIRKRIVSKFPYSILYRVESREIIILAIMHQRRRPGYWIDRV